MAHPKCGFRLVSFCVSSALSSIWLFVCVFLFVFSSFRAFLGSWRPRGGRGAERTGGQSQRPEKLMTADGGAFCVRFGMASQSPGGFGRPPGLHTTTRELQTAHLSAPALQTPPHEETPRERRKNEISGGREQKKREILGPHPSAPTPSGPPPLRAPTKTKKLANCGLAKFGQTKLAKFAK